MSEREFFGRTELSEAVAPSEACEIVIHARHFCFVRGSCGRHPEKDFRRAFLTLTAIYNELKRPSGLGIPTAKKRKTAPSLTLRGKARQLHSGAALTPTKVVTGAESETGK